MEDRVRHGFRAQKAALQILHLFSFFHNESIEEIFKRSAASQRLKHNPKARYSFDHCAKLSELLEIDANGIWDPFLFRKGISMLTSFSLVKQDQSRRFISMHILVHSWARDHMPNAARTDQLCTAIALLSSFISWRSLTEDYTFRRQLLPHIRTCKTSTAAKETNNSDNLDNANNFSLVFYEGAHWQEAEELEVQLMNTRKRVLGQEHPDTLTSMCNLAFTWKSQGRDVEAFELLNEYFLLQK
jgi:Tetratricopeptide repeat